MEEEKLVSQQDRRAGSRGLVRAHRITPEAPDQKQQHSVKRRLKINEEDMFAHWEDGASGWTEIGKSP